MLPILKFVLEFQKLSWILGLVVDLRCAVQFTFCRLVSKIFRSCQNCQRFSEFTLIIVGDHIFLMQSLLDNSPNLKQLQDFLFMNLLSLYDFLMSLGYEDASPLLLFYENVYVWNIDGATEILQTMSFILNNFL